MKNKQLHNPHSHIRQDKVSVIYTAFVYFFLIFLTLVIAYPLYFCVIASFSDPNAVATGDTILWFKGFTVDAYTSILKEDLLWTGFRNSILYTVAGTLFQVGMTIPAAYVSSKTRLPGHKLITWFFFLTTILVAGLVPMYLWYKKLGLVNNSMVMVVGSGLNTYFVLVTRQFFKSSIPDALYEAAYVDGASEWKQFTTVALPLSKPILAVISLYYAFQNWNGYYLALVFLKDQDKWPLQLVLKHLLISSETAVKSMIMKKSADVSYLQEMLYAVRGMKYAIILIATIPMLLLYPFASKYFAQGVMVGSIKE